MNNLEKPNLIKLLLGILFCNASSFASNFLLGPDPDSSSLFWILPGLSFGLALTIPNISSVQGFKWKLVSLFCFPLMTIVVWVANIFIAWILGGAVSNIFGLKVGLIFIGLYSSLIVFGAFNFFFSRQIKLLNYLIVGILGAISFVTVDNIYLNEGQGMTNHFDKLIYIWQTLVGIGISITFKKEYLKPFIKIEPLEYA